MKARHGLEIIGHSLVRRTEKAQESPPRHERDGSATLRMIRSYDRLAHGCNKIAKISMDVHVTR